LADNVVIICSIENLDPMGHPHRRLNYCPQTLTDKEYQLRDAAIDYPRNWVETGGSNIQFAVNPVNGSLLSLK